MEAILEREVLTQKHEDVKMLIYSTVWKFKNKHGGDFDIMLSEANLAFMKASESYNESKGVFTTWMVNKINYALLEFERRGCRRKERLPITDKDFALIDTTNNPNPFLDIQDEMKEDCSIIANVILQDLVNYPINTAKRLSPARLRGGLRRYLQNTLQWGNAKINKAFSEMEGIVNAI